MFKLELTATGIGLSLHYQIDNPDQQGGNSVTIHHTVLQQVPGSNDPVPP